MKEVLIKIGVWLSFYFFFTAQLQAQQTADLSGTDSAEVVGNAYEQIGRNLTSSVVRWSPFNNADRSNQTSLVSGFNTTPGIRMEERSPGSYRLNIRGSSLRSPFGVRNVKMYWNEIPFTDPGGNTYFNQLALNSAQSFVINKGPAGSMYGAGTGGLVLMESTPFRWQPGTGISYSFGSFGLQNIAASADFGKMDNRNHFSAAHNQSDGYRKQSAMRRDNLSWTSRLKISDKQQLTASFLFTNMYYQTPGALTKTEYEADPSAARPATPGLPSAEQAHAAIYQTNVLAGVTNKQTINAHWSNTTALYAAFAQVKNPAIRNYEMRSEPHTGIRSFFAYNQKKENTQLKWIAGGEFQAGFFNTQVSKNKNGQRDSLLTNDDQQFYSGFAFTQIEWTWNNKIYFTGGFSINQNKVSITRNSVVPVATQERTYSNEFAPRLQAKYRWSEAAETKFTFSKGYSPPTVSELLPSTGRIGTDLNAEHGYNYELANSFSMLHNRLHADIAAFYFGLKDALVQQRDASGGDYYINAGSTQQWGIESSLNYLQWFDRSRFVDAITAQLSYTYSNFTYSQYNKLGVDYTGNFLPGVPKHAVSAMADVQFKKGFYFNTTYYFNSVIMLNDANSFKSDAFNLLQARAGYKFKCGKKIQWHVFAGADNLLNEHYSLGNDINAAGIRFYNAAPTRNYYAGVGFEWH